MKSQNCWGIYDFEEKFSFLDFNMNASWYAIRGVALARLLSGGSKGGTWGPVPLPPFWNFFFYKSEVY